MPQVYSVSEFVSGINELLSGIPAIVQGEISNFRVAQNRFVWFDLKDDKSYVSCFMLSFQLDQTLEDGMEVQVIGNPGLFSKSGKFHLRAKKVQIVGAGSLKREYELLKEKLTKEGLFDESRKRDLPRFPKRIGLVTSKDAAAYTDVLRILKNRWAGLEISLFPVNVQGASAVPSVINALKLINAEYATQLDVVILTRGGGSMEDLQAFNDEGVTRAVFSSKVPIVTAIGHERDETLAEYAADRRASTPSNAAEQIVPDKRDVIAQLYVSVARTEQMLRNQQRVAYEQTISSMNLLASKMGSYRSEVERLEDLLHSYNPKAVLERGYSITQTANGEVVRKATEVRPGTRLITTVQDGKIDSQVL